MHPRGQREVPFGGGGPQTLEDTLLRAALRYFGEIVARKELDVMLMVFCARERVLGKAVKPVHPSQTELERIDHDTFVRDHVGLDTSSSPLARIKVPQPLGKRSRKRKHPYINRYR